MTAPYDETPIGSDDPRVLDVLLDPITHRPMPIKYVDPRTLRLSRNHPPVLRDARYFAGLAEAKADGRIRHPLTVRPDGLVLNGHRRRETALELGFQRVPVVFFTDEHCRASFLSYRPNRRAQIALRIPELRTLLLGWSSQERAAKRARRRKRR